jgi:methyl-accepting chemotaxis protein
MTVKGKLIGILALLLVLFAGTSLLTYTQLQGQTPQLTNMAQQTTKVASAYVPLLETSKQIKFHVVQVQQWISDISATRAQDGLNDGIEVAGEHAGLFNEQVAKAKELATGLGLNEVVALLEKAEADFPTYFETGVKMANSYIADGPAGGNKIMEDFDAVASTIGDATDKVSEAVSAVTNQVLSDMNAKANTIQEDNASLVKFLIILTLIGVAIAIVGSIILFQLISSSLNGLTADIETVASQDDAREMVLDTNRSDEFGVVAHALADFRVKLAEVEQMKEDQADIEKQASQERRDMRLKMADDFESSVGGVVDGVATMASQMQSSAQEMSATAQDTSSKSTTVAAAAEEASTNVQTVASAAEELSSSISEISRQVSQSTEIAGTAVGAAEKADEMVQGLAMSANKIGEVVELITDIADQTNLLALNATIEAARAGDAGKGFAVVASEVKNLANQTARATEEIGGQIGDIQGATQNSVKAIQGITKTIGEISEISSAIAAAVEEQGAATSEIARNVEQAASGTGEVTANIAMVNQAAAETGQSAGSILEAVGELTSQSTALKGAVETFLGQVRAG